MAIRQIGNNSFIGLDTDLPTSKPSGSFFFSENTNKLYCYFSGGTPTLVPIEDLEVSVVNTSGTLIPKGSVVYVNGASGGKPTIALALSNTNNATSTAIGIVKSDIANTSGGTIVTNGVIDKLNTSGFTNGSKVYLSSTVAGGLTVTQPSSPNNVTTIGTVINSNATLGKIFIGISYQYSLDSIVDVSASAPINHKFFSGK